MPGIFGRGYGRKQNPTNNQSGLPKFVKEERAKQARKEAQEKKERDAKLKKRAEEKKKKK